MTTKIVLKLHVHDAKMKQKAMKAVSSIQGVVSLAMDMKEQKLTVVGDVDPVQVVSKLRKHWHADIITVGPAKEPEKKDEKKDEKKECEQIAELIKYYKTCYPYYTPHYRVYSCEEDPNSCTIC